MKQRGLPFAFAVSLLAHIVIIPVALTLKAAPNPLLPDRIDITLVDMQRLERRDEPVALKPARSITEEKVVPPKLLEKPAIVQAEPAEPPPPVPAQPTPPNPPLMNVSEAAPAASPPTAGEQTLPPHGQAGAAASDRDRGGGGVAKSGVTAGTSGAGPSSFPGGDVAVNPGSGVSAGMGGDGPGRAARPSVVHQVKPRYPDSARRAGAEGVTLLRVRVLENGLVGEVMVEKSAGFPDLDAAAAEGVRKWRFTPASRGREPIAVWVLLPVRFELR